MLSGPQGNFNNRDKVHVYKCQRIFGAGSSKEVEACHTGTQQSTARVAYRQRRPTNVCSDSEYSDVGVKTEHSDVGVTIFVLESHPRNENCLVGLKIIDSYHGIPWSKCSCRTCCIIDSRQSDLHTTKSEGKSFDRRQFSHVYTPFRRSFRSGATP